MTLPGKASSVTTTPVSVPAPALSDKAKWSDPSKKVTAVVETSGSVKSVLPVEENGAVALTVTTTITSSREVIVHVHGEPGAKLHGFQAWSNI